MCSDYDPKQRSSENGCEKGADGMRASSTLPLLTEL